MSVPDQVTHQFDESDLLRLVIIGSVDDGKSTLLGRLLFDTKSIFEDQLNLVKKYSGTRNQEIDFSLFTDGLRAEREQGITIDVAYRYFSTARRRFIVADTPGHEQYTRNMATGASTASISLMLVDVSRGVTTQTKRHAFISSLLGIRHFIVAVNKMDLAGYSGNSFDDIVNQFMDFSEKLRIESVQFIPVSALKGDNIIEKSSVMPWYDGPSILHYLESVHIPSARNLIDFRLPVQYVNWAGSGSRGYCGTVASGIIRLGEEIMVLPTLKRTTVRKILANGNEVSYAFAPQSVTLYCTDELDIGRGDMITRPLNTPCITEEVEANIVWFDDAPLQTGKEYIIKHTTRTVRGTFSRIKYLFDPEDLHRHPADTLYLNQIGKTVLKLLKPVFVDLYDNNRQTGCFIVIDTFTNRTVGAGMITRCLKIPAPHSLTHAAGEGRGRTFWYSGRDGRRSAREHCAKDREKGMGSVYIDEEILQGKMRHSLTDSLKNEDYLLLVASICKTINDSGQAVIVGLPWAPTSDVKKFIGIDSIEVINRNMG